MRGIRSLGACCWLVGAALLCACGNDDDFSALPVVGLGGAGPDLAPVTNPALWRWKDCGHVASAQPAVTSAVLSVAVSPDGEHAVTATGSSVVGWRLVENFDDSSVEWVVESPGATNARYSQDGAWVAVSGDDPQLLTAQGVSAFRPPSDPNPSKPPCGMQTLALSPDGRWLAHSRNFGVTVFDLATLQEVVRLPTTDCIGAAVFSPDSQYLMTAVPELYQTSDWTRAWPVALGQYALSPVNGVAFSPVGREAIISTCRPVSEGDAPYICYARWFTIGGRPAGTVYLLTSAWPDFAAAGDWIISGHLALYQEREKIGMLPSEFTATTFAPNGDIVAGTLTGSLVRLCRN